MMNGIDKVITNRN